MDNDNFNLEDWKRQIVNPLEHWLSRLDDNQLKLLDEVKKQFNWHLDSYTQQIRDDLQCEIDMHISFDAKRELLQKKYAEIVNTSTQFLKSYRNVLNSNNTINEDEYIKFVKSYEVIVTASQWVIEENEMKALTQLEYVASLNVIERMLKILEDDKSKPFYSKIFTDEESQDFFDYVFDNWLKDESVFNTVHFVCRVMSKRSTYDLSKPYGIRCTQRELIKHWNKYYTPKCKYTDNMKFNENVSNPKINEKGKIGNSWDGYVLKFNKLKGMFKERR